MCLQNTTGHFPSFWDKPKFIFEVSFGDFKVEKCFQQILMPYVLKKYILSTVDYEISCLLFDLKFLTLEFNRFFFWKSSLAFK